MRDTPLRMIIVDDEPLAIERLQFLLDRSPGAEVVGMAPDGEKALGLAEALDPDLVLLDIAMPGLDGIDVARALSQAGSRAAIVFVTAFDNFAVAAFDLAAVDYLMKPVQPERLDRALDRVRDWLTAAPGQETPPSGHVDLFWVPSHFGLARISASDIDRVTAERDYMRLHIGPRSWLIHRTIGRLEQDLDSSLFIRVHRSVILRRDTIIGLYRDNGGHWTARLEGGGEQRIGGSYIDDVKRLAGRF